MAYVSDIKTFAGRPFAGLRSSVAAFFGRVWQAIIVAQERRADRLAEDFRNGRRHYI